jgi:hypothetical protein
MEKGEKTLAPVEPPSVMAPFKGQKQATGGDGGVVPEGQASIRHQQEAPAEQHSCCTDMPSADANAQPAHGTRGTHSVIGGVGGRYEHIGFSRLHAHTGARRIHGLYKIVGSGNDAVPERKPAITGYGRTI